ncbi:MAG: L,D-transpeptidase family protein, partial [Gemmatimonadetes bacterium]|nr:L,D-transpeptidase family protein [Gemmatimonadota bacterium]
GAAAPSPSWLDEELAPRLDRRLGSADLIGMQQQGFEAFTHAGARVSLDSLSWPPAAGFSSMYRLIQRPGAHNPLGRVKFDLDNPFAIYLHDTPAAGLFSRSARDLSHGCVRVDGIVDLVGQLLTTSALAGERFARLLASGETGRVDLPTPLPVYLLYWTASVTGGGEIRITADLYDVDRRLLEALQAVAGARHWLAAPIFRSASIGAESMQPITPRVATLQALIDLI